MTEKKEVDAFRDVQQYLPELLQIVDEKVQIAGVETLEALVTVNNNECSFTINPVDSTLSESVFYSNVV